MAAAAVHSYHGRMSRAADLLRPLIARRSALSAFALAAALLLASLPAITEVSSLNGTLLLTAPGHEGDTIPTELVIGWAIRTWWILTLLLIIGVLMHRRWPRAALVLTLAAAAGHLLDLYHVGLGVQPIDLIAALVLVVVVSRAATRRAALAALAPTLVVTYLAVGTPAGPALARAIEATLHPSLAPLPAMFDSPTNGLLVQLAIVAAFLAGEGIRTRHTQLQALQQHAAALHREQQQREQLAAAAERARIARDLHDIVAHRVTGMLIQTGAARALLADREPQALAALHAVEAGGRDAMAELRDLLGLLTTDTPMGTPLSPAPGIATLTTMANDAPLPVRLNITGDPHRLPRGIDLAAYRIVQEALTNTARHSTRSGSSVDVHVGDTELDITIVDDDAATLLPATRGRGLTGMRERVTAYGGTITAGPRTDGRWQVQATLPLPATTSLA